MDADDWLTGQFEQHRPRLYRLGYRMLGHSSKLTAYALGISPAAVSAALKSSLQKLGIGSVAEMPHDLGGVAKAGSAPAEGDRWHPESP